MSPSVLHCYADYKWTGASEPISLLCRELTERGWRSELACIPAPPHQRRSLPGEARKMGVRVHDGFYFDSSPNLARNCRDVWRLRDLLEEGDYSLVHAHGSWDHVLAVLALPWNHPRPPLVRTDHGGRPYHRLLHRPQFGRRMTDHLIVLSDGLRRRAIEKLGRPPGTVSTVRGFVDVEDFRPTRPPPGTRERFGLGADDFVFALVARVQWHRRFEVLLEAALRLRERAPHLKVAVLGRGTHKEEILDRPVERMGLQGTLYPLGYRRDDYREVLAACDAGLMLVPGSDATCRAAMQLCAMAKPMVVARRGVLPEIVEDGATGIVVEDTPGNLAGALLEMAGMERERLRRWGRAARERMRRLFNLERQAGAVIEVYEKALGRLAGAS